MGSDQMPAGMKGSEPEAEPAASADIHEKCVVHCSHFIQVAKFINVQSYTAERWASEFGMCTASHQWGERFWQGFENILRRYNEVHLYYIPPSSFKPGIMKQPVNFSKRTVRTTWKEGDSVAGRGYPCYWAVIGDEWRKVVCIHIGIYVSCPWTAHYTWLDTWMEVEL